MKRLRYTLFGAYIFLVLWLTLIDRQFDERRAMLVPFWEFANVIKRVECSFYIGQILGNLTILLPLGFMLPMIRKVTIELTQYITERGLMEFDDVFNNTAGAAIGYMIYNGVRRMANEKI